MDVKQGLPIIPFASPREWEAWLATHHTTSTGLWLKIAKKDTGTDTVSYAEALDVALCYGWIDGQKAAFDEQFWLQRFSPRGPKSKWSQVNRDKVAALIEQGRVQPAGLAQVEQAKQDGRWDAAYASARTATIPDDLQRLLDQHPAAQALFSTLDSANRYAILYRLQDAKKPETRARRLAQFIAMLDEGKKLHP